VIGNFSKVIPAPCRRPHHARDPLTRGQRELGVEA